MLPVGLSDTLRTSRFKVYSLVISIVKIDYTITDSEVDGVLTIIVADNSNSDVDTITNVEILQFENFEFVKTMMRNRLIVITVITMKTEELVKEISISPSFMGISGLISNCASGD